MLGRRERISDVVFFVERWSRCGRADASLTLSITAPTRLKVSKICFICRSELRQRLALVAERNCFQARSEQWKVSSWMRRTRKRPLVSDTCNREPLFEGHVFILCGRTRPFLLAQPPGPPPNSFLSLAAQLQFNASPEKNLRDYSKAQRSRSQSPVRAEGDSKVSDRARLRFGVVSGLQLHRTPLIPSSCESVRERRRDELGSRAGAKRADVHKYSLLRRS